MATPYATPGDCGPVIPASPTDSKKYRRSCDRCQNNKVRCSRDKPTCKGCAHKRLPCVYSPVRKIGRPRKAISGEAVPNFSEEQEEGEDDDDRENGSSAREASTLSPSGTYRHSHRKLHDSCTNASKTPTRLRLQLLLRVWATLGPVILTLA
jgi:hypothetical protein